MIYLISAHANYLLGRPSTSRTFGFYHYAEDAIAAVEHDEGGMHESLYEWLCIEALLEGIHATATVLQWYHWDSLAATWKQCDAPAWSVGLLNLGGVG